MLLFFQCQISPIVLYATGLYSPSYGINQSVQLYNLLLRYNITYNGPGLNLLIFFVVRCMMYGFGDDQAPFTESVDLLEDLVIEYISEMVCFSGFLICAEKRNRY